MRNTRIGTFGWSVQQRDMGGSVPKGGVPVGDEPKVTQHILHNFRLPIDAKKVNTQLGAYSQRESRREVCLCDIEIGENRLGPFRNAILSVVFFSWHTSCLGSWRWEMCCKPFDPYPYKMGLLFKFSSYL